MAALLGRWRGTTEILPSPGGPVRLADAEVTFTLAAGGYAVIQSYRHTEPDGSHFEGHGIFTVDPDQGDTLWYFVDNAGSAPEAPARGTWHGDTLVIERRTAEGTSRHTFRVDDGVLTQIAELRHGGATAFTPFFTSVCRKT
ncbi:DUF1579 domain-containing protein [Arthrobacter sp. M4]|nr:DUF1579 domain-containing protein [Arthrobacter sp. M4]